MHCIFAITAAVLLCLIGQAHLACQSQTVDQWVPDNVKLMSLEFGLKDSTNGSVRNLKNAHPEVDLKNKIRLRTCGKSRIRKRARFISKKISKNPPC